MLSPPQELACFKGKGKGPGGKEKDPVLQRQGDLVVEMRSMLSELTERSSREHQGGTTGRVTGHSEALPGCLPHHVL